MSTIGYLTQNQLIELKLLTDRAEIDTTRISDLIQSDISTTFKRSMADGVNYYMGVHEILSHVNYYYVDGVQQEDRVKANNRIPHPFHKILVDQKAAYISGNPVVFAVSEDDESSKGQEFHDALIKHLDERFDDRLNDWIIGSSNKGVEWMHFYINPRGELVYCIVPAEQVIGVYDTQYQQDLVYVIRFYLYDEVNSKSGQVQRRYKVEWWSKTEVEYWVQIEGGSFVHDPDYAVNPAPHWFSFNTSTPSIKDNHSWGKVPFVPLWNNSEMQNDLNPVRALIDAYDKVKSGWVNDLDDFNEMIYVLKGFQGLSSEATAGYSQLALFMHNLKKNKAVGVEADGAVTTLRSEIPVEAKEKFLSITRSEIFYFGEGVDVGDTQNIGAAPSGVALKFLYASLDLKANRMIRKLKTALKDFAWFVTEFINRTESKKYDPLQVIFTINKSMVFNEREKIDGLVASKDMLSQRTLLQNHPYVEDVEEEMSRLEAEKAEIPEPEVKTPEEIEAERLAAEEAKNKELIEE